ncbi:hypothetical protein [Cellulomonas iranensis]|uniref:hypothetical protein n=1 Tax=Cellulomonas iranensis TaxID=76862 RepID=UPI0013D6F2E6|nr:hypothetical protein [Cellulomonas iranensis]
MTALSLRQWAERDPATRLPLLDDLLLRDDPRDVVDVLIARHGRGADAAVARVLWPAVLEALGVDDGPVTTATVVAAVGLPDEVATWRPLEVAMVVVEALPRDVLTAAVAAAARIAPDVVRPPDIDAPGLLRDTRWWWRCHTCGGAHRRRAIEQQRQKCVARPRTCRAAQHDLGADHPLRVAIRGVTQSTLPRGGVPAGTRVVRDGGLWTVVLPRRTVLARPVPRTAQVRAWARTPQPRTRQSVLAMRCTTAPEGVAHPLFVVTAHDLVMRHAVTGIACPACRDLIAAARAVDPADADLTPEEVAALLAAPGAPRTRLGAFGRSCATLATELGVKVRPGWPVGELPLGELRGAAGRSAARALTRLAAAVVDSAHGDRGDLVPHIQTHREVVRMNRNIAFTVAVVAVLLSACGPAAAPTTLTPSATTDTASTPAATPPVDTPSAVPTPLEAGSAVPAADVESARAAGATVYVSPAGDGTGVVLDPAVAAEPVVADLIAAGGGDAPTSGDVDGATARATALREVYAAAAAAGYEAVFVITTGLYDAEDTLLQAGYAVRMADGTPHRAVGGQVLSHDEALEVARSTGYPVIDATR